MKKLSVSAKLYLVFALAFLVAEYSRGGDLAIFMAASKALWEGKDIYTNTYYAGFHYLYSPLFAVLIHPLTVLPIAVSGTIWKALSFLMIARTYWVMRRTFQLKEERIQLVLILSFLAVLLPIYSNTHLIQLSAFLLWAILESLDLIFRRNMKVAGAALLALVINIKLLPLAFLAYLIYRG
ncbi:MAG: glycosyltransferase family 87 protein, partial [Flavobacteriales bacterium]